MDREQPMLNLEDSLPCKTQALNSMCTNHEYKHNPCHDADVYRKYSTNRSHNKQKSTPFMIPSQLTQLVRSEYYNSSVNGLQVNAGEAKRIVLGRRFTRLKA